MRKRTRREATRTRRVERTTSKDCMRKRTRREREATRTRRVERTTSKYSKKTRREREATRTRRKRTTSMGGFRRYVVWQGGFDAMLCGRSLKIGLVESLFGWGKDRRRRLVMLMGGQEELWIVWGSSEFCRGGCMSSGAIMLRWGGRRALS